MKVNTTSLLIDLTWLRAKLHREYYAFFTEGEEPVPFSSFFPLLINYALERLVRRYSMFEGKILDMITCPEHDLSDIDGFLTKATQTVQQFFARQLIDDAYLFNQWKIQYDQRTLLLTQNVHL